MFLFYFWIKHNHAKSLRLWLTLCDPMDCSLPGSSVHGILQARILKWVVVPASRASSWPRDGTRASSISYSGRWLLYHLGQSLSMLLQMTEFPSFSWLNDIPLCVCVIHCVYMCIYMCVFVCVWVCVYSSSVSIYPLKDIQILPVSWLVFFFLTLIPILYSSGRSKC